VQLRPGTVLNQYLDHKLASAVDTITRNSDYNLAAAANRVYGFIPNLKLSYWENSNNIMGEMKPYQYFMRPNNMAYHNLCLNASPPPGITSLLGLGIKFCIESPRLNQGIATRRKE
jgi:hypothetical protein